MANPVTVEAIIKKNGDEVYTLGLTNVEWDKYRNAFLKDVQDRVLEHVEPILNNGGETIEITITMQVGTVA